MNLTELFRSVVSLSLLGSILVIGLLLTKTLLRGKLSAKWHYYIWFLLLLRLLVPFTVPASYSVSNLIPHNQPESLSQVSMPDPEKTTWETEVQPNEIAVNAAPEKLNGNNSIEYQPSQSLKSWLNWPTLAMVWIIGVIAIFLYIVFINLLLLYRTRRLPECASEDILGIMEECQTALKIHGRIPIVFDNTLKSPGLFGIIHPRIIISPEIIKKLAPDELRFIILHELSHLKRRDLVVNVVVMAVQTIYWFNPLFWLALGQMKQDCEIACDATVLSALKAEDHRRYGQTIINLLQMLSEPHWAPGTLGFASKYNSRRIIMISSFKKNTAKWAIVLTLTLLAGCSSLNSPLDTKNTDQGQKSTAVSSQPNSSTNSPTPGSNSILYKNAVYGFNFTLPTSWQGYSIIAGDWSGSDIATGKTTETGPMISIRHPLWTSQKPRQDIPIMIFTPDQWNLLQQEKFHIGAAPIGPSKLGQNSRYVFALPARYNYAFPTGYEEVEKILKDHPLQAANVNNSAATTLLNIMQLARQGKVINSEFSVKTSNFGDVETKWGKADQTAWVSAAKGTYSTYAKQNLVFGWNKGLQIFEVRSFDSRLKGISLSQVKEVLGTPAWSSKTNNQEIVGYTAGAEFKLEIVFAKPSGDNLNPVIDHYNVLYPAGTVNSMANDPGRQW